MNNAFFDRNFLYLSEKCNFAAERLFFIKTHYGKLEGGKYPGGHRASSFQLCLLRIDCFLNQTKQMNFNNLMSSSSCEQLSCVEKFEQPTSLTAGIL